MSFFKQHLKIIILTVFVLVIIGILILHNTNKAGKITVKENIEYNYFAMYDVSGKVRSYK